MPSHRLRPLVAVLAASLVVACGSSEPSPPSPPSSSSPEGGTPTATTPGATVSGEVTGRPLAPVEAFARRSNLYNQGDISIYLASRGGICDTVKVSPEGLANTTFLSIDLPRSWPPPVGIYPIVSSIQTLADGGITMGAFARLKATDATCGDDAADDDTKAQEGGTITIEVSTSAIVTGRFDLQFTKGNLQGTFAVPLCDVAFPSGTPRACL